MSSAQDLSRPLWYRLVSPLRILGTPAPVFPGYELDIGDSVEDQDRLEAIWHRDRARAMLREHPEIRDLMGREPSTALWCVLFSASQFGVAIGAAYVDWWLVAVLAFVVGAWLNICLFNLAHDCNHSLIFRSKSWNRWLFTLTSLPMFLPGHHSWWIEHHVHHNSLGSRKDFIQRRRHLFLMTRSRVLFVITQGPIYRALTWLSSPLFTPYSLIMCVTQFARTAVGLLLYCLGWLRLRFIPGRFTLSVLADEHLVSGYQRYRLEGWAVAYAVLSLGSTGALFWFGGWKSVAYLVLSQTFMSGFMHPVMFGLILSNSHFHGHDHYQPSSSYYGWLNWITFNFGLHTEHHDLATVPWSRLGELRKIAPEYYDDLIKTKSYSWLAFRFTFCDRPTLQQLFINRRPAAAVVDAHEAETEAAEAIEPSDAC